MNANVFLSLLAAAILAGQLVILRRQRTLMELDALHSVRDSWRDLQPAWAVTLAMGGGMYVKMTPDVIELFPEAQRIADIHDEIGVYVTERAGAFEQLPADSLEVPIRDSLEFLGFVCSLILRGTLSPATAYEALGTSIVRNGTPMRRLLSEPERSGYFLTWYPGVADRIRVLVDLLWVEAVRSRDIAQAEIDRALAAKRQHHTQYRNRARMRPLARRLGGLTRMVSLEWHLTYAETAPDVGAARRSASRLGRLVRGWIAPPRNAS